MFPPEFSPLRDHSPYQMCPEFCRIENVEPCRLKEFSHPSRVRGKLGATIALVTVATFVVAALISIAGCVFG